MRVEHDLLGEREVPEEAYWGIHTLRAKENFPVSGYTIHPEFIRALAQVKKACAMTNLEMGYLAKDVGGAIISACDEIIEGKFHDQFIVDVFQGGAGTSTNMNANEVIANRAIETLGGKRGDYHLVHPNNHVNMHQSTNDVVPTAIKVAMIKLFRQLPATLANLEGALQKKAGEFATILKMGRTEHQDAVPITLGDEFAAYAKVVGRDRFRMLECERILSRVNLGGTVLGTGIAAPKRFGRLAIEKLNQEAGLELFQAGDLIDCTQNLDCFAAVSGALKIHAANISKITSDLMLLHSGPRTGFTEIRLPEMQAGSSIMPGKVNPVIGEMVEQVAMQVISNDYVVCEVIRRGRLELNAFLPLLSYCLFESVSLLDRAERIFTEKCVSGIEANEEVCQLQIERGWKNWGLPALVPYIGYARATDIACQAKREGKTVREVIISEDIFSQEELDKILMEGITAFGEDE
ncbi:MAG: aspartate ammonia-lyase [Dehalococcoidia bacterium]|nr:aspartate ammonia-lyase [Dehalococcoidia bacterium]